MAVFSRFVLLFLLLSVLPSYGQDLSETAIMQPVLRKWLDYYGLDLSQAVAGETSCYDIEVDPYKGSIYYREFTEKEDNSNRLTVHYSPNKMRYVDLGFLMYDETEGFEVWGDDCQEIYLVDRQLKVNNMICWFGSVPRAEAVFWKDNDTFYLVGSTDARDRIREFFIYEYDLAVKTKKEYSILAHAGQKEFMGYMIHVTVPERTALLKANPGRELPSGCW